MENENWPLSTLDASLWNTLNDECPLYTLDASLWNMLNDDLVQKIIGRLPFKSLFRALLLSKTWSQKLLNHSVLNKVLGTSYSLLRSNEKKELIGYESGSQQWHRLATQPYLPPSVEWGPWASAEERTWSWHLNLMAVGGSILCWMWTTTDACQVSNRNSRNWQRPPLYPFYLCVSNPLTKSWKQLPPCPHTKGRDESSDDSLYEINVHVVNENKGTNAYQVVFIANVIRVGDLCVYIFDSGSGIWTTDKFKWRSDEPWFFSDTMIQWGYMWRQSVYTNGVIYLGSTCDQSSPIPDWYSIISFDVENKTWSEQKLSIHQQEGFNNHQRLELVGCGSNVMLVGVRHSSKISGRGNLCVYTVDLQLGLAFAVSKAPNDIFDLFMGQETGWPDFFFAGGVDNCIYFNTSVIKTRFRNSRLRWLTYNVTTQKWDWLPAPDKWGPFPNPSWCRPPCTLTAYQPGLNILRKFDSTK